MAGKRKRTICSIYLPPTGLVTKKDIRDLLEQLPAPMILLEHFNALWGSEKISTREENAGENPRQIRPFVPKQKRRNLL